MKKTVSLAAAALLALTLGACNSGKSDKPDPQPTTPEETTEATSSEEETTAEETTSEEETSKEPTNSADGDLPEVCRTFLTGLKVGDVVPFDDLSACAMAAAENVSSARVHTKVSATGTTMVMEGVYERKGDQVNFDMSSEAVKARRIGDDVWIYEHGKWHTADPNNPIDKPFIESMDPDYTMKSSTDLLGGTGEVTVTELSDDKYVFTMDQPDTAMGSMKMEFTYNKQFYSTATTFVTDGMEMETTSSHFNEPVDIQPPM